MQDYKDTKGSVILMHILPHARLFPPNLVPKLRLGTYDSKLRFANARALASYTSAYNPPGRWTILGRARLLTDSKQSFGSCVPKREFGNECVCRLSQFNYVGVGSDGVSIGLRQSDRRFRP